MHLHNDTRRSKQIFETRSRRPTPPVPGTLSTKDLRRIVAEMLG